MAIHIVTYGDTVDSIAAEYEVQAAGIIYDNQLVYPYQLAIGQALLVQQEELTGYRNIICNGFAYPFISRWTLEQTLPFLTEMSVFSYGFNTEGNLVPPQLSPDWMISLAEQYQTIPTLTLTPLGEDGKFNNNLIHAVLNNTTYRNQLITNVLEECLQKGYRGVNVDFEYILVEDRDIFTGFVRDITNQMRENGIMTTVDLAPKTSSQQRGVLYEGKDYAGLGSVADYVLLMTYEWGYTYGPAMAVAPIQNVRQVVEYALTQIPAYKVNLGVPNYGYDWILPYVAGESKATTIGNIQAVQIAIENNAEIYFDETAQAPHFNYTKNGEVHEVWFEDVRSIRAKKELYLEYGLHGLGYWQIMQLFRGNWLVLNSSTA